MTIHPSKNRKAALFGRLYVFGCLIYLASALILVRESPALDLLITATRVTLMMGIAMGWMASRSHKIRIRQGATIFYIVLLAALIPHLALDSVATAVNIAVTVFLADLIRRTGSPVKLLSDTSKIILIAISLIAVASKIELLPTRLMVWGDVTKDSVGFANPNFVGVMVFSCAAVFFLAREFRRFLAACIVFAALYGSIGSRTSLLALAILALAWPLPEKSPKALKQLGIHFFFSLILGAGVLSVIFPFEFEAILSFVLGTDANILLSQRLEVLQEISNNRSTLNLLIGGVRLGADSLYQMTSSTFGILFLFLIILFSLRSMHVLVKNGLYRPAIAILVFFAVGLVEMPLNQFIPFSLLVIVFLMDPLSIQMSTASESWRETPAGRGAIGA